MSRFTKIAITVPTATYRGVEKARNRLGMTRSAAIATALEEWLRGLEAGEAERRYVEAYLRQPESDEELAVTEAFARAALAEWAPWAPGRASRASDRRSARPKTRTRP